MSLKTTFQKAAQTAGAAFSGVFSSASYNVVGSAVYDVSTGTVSAGSSTVVISILFTDYSTAERANSNIEPTDMKGVIPRLDLPVAPSTRDTITKEGQSFQIVDYRTYPAEALWVLQLRRG